jgi:hypothetical protein
MVMAACLALLPQEDLLGTVFPAKTTRIVFTNMAHTTI